MKLAVNHSLVRPARGEARYIEGSLCATDTWGLSILTSCNALCGTIFRNMFLYPNPLLLSTNTDTTEPLFISWSFAKVENPDQNTFNVFWVHLVVSVHEGKIDCSLGAHVQVRSVHVTNGRIIQHMSPMTVHVQMLTPHCTTLPACTEEWKNDKITRSQVR